MGKKTYLGPFGEQVSMRGQGGSDTSVQNAGNLAVMTAPKWWQVQK